MELEEMNIKTTGTAAIIYHYKALLEAIDVEQNLNGIEADELYYTLWNTFPKLLDAILVPKCFVLWSDEGGAEVHILDGEKEVEDYIQTADWLFGENPIPDSNDHNLDEFKQKCRFAVELSLEQFKELAGDKLDNPNFFAVDERGLTFEFDDYTSVIEARTNGKI